MIRKWIQRLEAWAQNDFLANSEAESNRSGYLSYRAEFHAAAWGVAAAIAYLVTKEPTVALLGIGWVFSRSADGKVPGWLPYPKQFAKESLYVAGHFAGVITIYYIAQVLISVL